MGIQYVSGEVGEGGDHMNLTFKNLGKESITINGDKVVVFISEDPNEIDPNIVTKLKYQSLSDQIQKKDEVISTREQEKEREGKEQKEKEERERTERDNKEKQEKERKVKEQKEKEERERKEKEERERKEKEQKEKERKEKERKEQELREKE